MSVIEQRITDGYINGTHLCEASGKQIGHYLENKSTIAFFDALSSDIGIPISALVQSVKGGNNKHLQGTWVHPQVAINLGQWASPKFAVLISKWVIEWVNGNIPHKGGKLPYHIQRYLANRSLIPHDHFSVLSELAILLIAPLEDSGYELPSNLVPDISQGRLFSAWVKEKYDLESDDFPTYLHEYPDGRKYPSRLYPIEFLAEFRKHFYDVWIRQRATDYFSKKDKNALPYLVSVIKSLDMSPIPPKRIKSKEEDYDGEPDRDQDSMNNED